MPKVLGLGLMTRRLMVTYLITFFRGTYFGMLSLTLPLYVVSIGISVMDLGILVAALGAGMLFFEPIWGFLSDKAGRKFFIVASLFLGSLIIPMYLFKEFVPLFIVLQFLRGAVRVMAAPSIRAFVSDTVSSKDLGTAMGILWSTLLFGSMVGSFVAGTRIYEDSFLISSIIALFAAVFSLLVLKESRKPQQHETNSGYKSRQLKNPGLKIFFVRNLVILLLVAIISVMGLSLIRSFLPIFATQKLGASDVDVGIVLAIFNGVTALVVPLFGRISDRVGRKPLILTGLCLGGSMMLCYTFVKDSYQIMLVTAGAAAGFSLVAPASLALLTSSITSDTYGAAMGVYGASEDLGAMIGPAIYGVLWSIYGAASIFYAYAVVEAASTVLVLMLREKRKVVSKT